MSLDCTTLTAVFKYAHVSLVFPYEKQIFGVFSLIVVTKLIKCMLSGVKENKPLSAPALKMRRNPWQWQPTKSKRDINSPIDSSLMPGINTRSLASCPCQVSGALPLAGCCSYTIYSFIMAFGIPGLHSPMFVWWLPKLLRKVLALFQLQSGTAVRRQLLPSFAVWTNGCSLPIIAREPIWMRMRIRHAQAVADLFRDSRANEAILPTHISLPEFRVTLSLDPLSCTNDKLTIWCSI